MRRTLTIILSVIVIIMVVLATLFISSQCLIPGICNNKLTLNATTLLTKIQSLSALTTTRYTFSTIITTESDMPGLLKGLYGQKQVMVAVGYITAGIDMKEAKATNVNDGESLNLLLPAPTLQDCILDEGKTYIAALEKGIFAPSNPTIDQESRRFAVQQLRQAAIDGNILTEAETQAKTAITDFVTLLGFSNIRISFQSASPNTPLPESCA